jgi:hypothetical protein
MHHMTRRANTAPEPSFARLVTDQDLATLVVSGHALRRFVQRLQPEIPGAEQIAEAMAALEDLEGARSIRDQLLATS